MEVTNSGGISLALNTAVEGLRKASKDVADVAQDVAENGVEGFERNFVELALAKLQFKANAAVIRTADEMTDRLLDILA